MLTPGGRLNAQTRNRGGIGPETRGKHVVKLCMC
jgi:hypothetical protein